MYNNIQASVVFLVSTFKPTMYTVFIYLYRKLYTIETDSVFIVSKSEILTMKSGYLFTQMVIFVDILIL